MPNPSDLLAVLAIAVLAGLCVPFVNLASRWAAQEEARRALLSEDQRKIEWSEAQW